MWPRLSPEDLGLFEPFRCFKENSQSPVRAVFFDIGSVLIDLDWDSFFARQQELNPDDKNFSVDRMMTRIRENQLMVRWCTGHLGPYEYVEGMLEAAGHSKDKAQRLAYGTERLSNGAYAPALVKELSSLIVGPARPRIVRLIQTLRKKNYIVGALSNATPWHESDIMRTTSLHELFDVVVFSQDVGSEKPDAKIYESAHQAAQKIYAMRSPNKASTLDTAQLAFVDDTPINVRAARNLGWQSSLVCLLKDDLLSKARALDADTLAQLSTQSQNLVFGDEAAKRVEGLFVELLSSAGK
ncbi:MAG: HAD-IA family hydrolase [Betaproteobacteria bacterium]|nr:HAD-IA family hydrolase [Betaproteobacteria bacterium]